MSESPARAKASALEMTIYFATPDMCVGTLYLEFSWGVGNCNAKPERGNVPPLRGASSEEVERTYVKAIVREIISRGGFISI